MANTYTKLYTHNIFAVDFRRSLINPLWEEELFKYITGTVQNLNQKMIAINGVEDHIHFLIGFKPTCCLSDLMREIKKSSTDFINKNKFIRQKFNWQEGFGSFSVSHSHLDKVSKYILNQKEHHRKKSFKEEYIQFLNNYNIPIEERFLFKWSLNDFSK
jgi:REP element-mobilizing transposase RayT